MSSNNYLLQITSDIGYGAQSQKNSIRVEEQIYSVKMLTSIVSRFICFIPNIETFSINMIFGIKQI